MIHSRLAVISFTVMGHIPFHERGLSVQKLVVLVMLCAVCGTAPVYSQPGFLSIDCGSRANYTDPTTGIYWETDEPYISTGSNVNNLDVVVPDSQSRTLLNPGQLSSARLFDDPGRRRDCYVLPTEPEQLYHIRPTLYYGNLTDPTRRSSSFSVYLNGTYWFNVIYIQHGGYDPQFSNYWEGVVYSRGKVLNFCIIRQAGSTSFISSLELRRLDTGMYSAIRTPLRNQQKFLNNPVRKNQGASDDGSILRYPDDVFDCLWTPMHGNVTQVRNSTAIASPRSARAPNQPPLKVMEDAITVYPPTDYLTYSATVDDASNLLVFVYYQDLDSNATAKNVRGMDFSLNGQLKQSFNSSSEAIEVVGLYSSLEETTINVTLERASWSRLAPVMNGLEIFNLQNYNVSQTAVDEVQVLSALQTATGFSDWDGDPCTPVPYRWINCVVDKNDDTLYRINSLSLNGRNISGPIPNQVFDFKELAFLSLDSNNISGALPNFSRLGLLQTLSIRDNKLNGNIQSLSSLVHIQTLHLENNSLNGTIPNFLSFFPNLVDLHLDNNQFTGDVPASLYSKRGLNFTYANNPGLRSKAPLSGGSRKSNIGVIIGGLSAGIVGLIIVGVILWRFATRKKRAESKILKAMRKANSAGNDDKFKKDAAARAIRFGRDGSAHSSLRIFLLKEVSDATKTFSHQIGQGAFGPVYYGKLSNGQEVAVKVKSGISHQGETEFLNEQSGVTNRYCEEADQEILIYAFVPNGSLRDYLSGNRPGNRSETPLDWKARLRIAVSSATGLEYLHFHCNPRIIHRDVKSSNILLDKNMVGKVADFGISKETMEGMTAGVDTHIKGTPGYMDPDYFSTQRLTKKSDVYSFGVVLLEIISGLHTLLKPLEDGEIRSLVEWVRESEREGNASAVFDPAMKNNFNYQSARLVLDLALGCTNPVSSLRPDMRQVLRALIQASQLEEGEDALVAPRVRSEDDTERLMVSRNNLEDLLYPRRDFFDCSNRSQDITVVELGDPECGFAELCLQSAYRGETVVYCVQIFKNSIEVARLLIQDLKIMSMWLPNAPCYFSL